jgi:hypothetical protein
MGDQPGVGLCVTLAPGIAAPLVGLALALGACPMPLGPGRDTPVGVVAPARPSPGATGRTPGSARPAGRLAPATPAETTWPTPPYAPPPPAHRAYRREHPALSPGLDEARRVERKRARRWVVATVLAVSLAAGAVARAARRLYRYAVLILSP